MLGCERVPQPTCSDTAVTFANECHKSINLVHAIKALKELVILPGDKKLCITNVQTLFKP